MAALHWMDASKLIASRGTGTTRAAPRVTIPSASTCSSRPARLPPPGRSCWWASPGSRLLAGALPPASVHVRREVTLRIANALAELHKLRPAPLDPPALESARTHPQVAGRVVFVLNRLPSAPTSNRRVHRAATGAWCRDVRPKKGSGAGRFRRGPTTFLLRGAEQDSGGTIGQAAGPQDGHRSITVKSGARVAWGWGRYLANDEKAFRLPAPLLLKEPQCADRLTHGQDSVIRRPRPALDPTAPLPSVDRGQRCARMPSSVVTPFGFTKGGGAVILDVAPDVVKERQDGPQGGRPRSRDNRVPADSIESRIDCVQDRPRLAVGTKESPYLLQ